MGKHYGRCALCGKECELTFEHTPPRAAFNSKPVKGVSGERFIRLDRNPWEIEDLPYINLQRGNGKYSLCSECNNNNTGSWYGEEYYHMVRAAYSLLAMRKKKPVTGIEIKDFYPLRFIKQVLSMFCSINPAADERIEPLRSFVLDKNASNLDMNAHDAPTMKDVAREANVSLGTVSKVINEIPVGEKYRKRVEAAATNLGYQVNNYARGLKTNKTYCVALVMPSLCHPFLAVLTDELTNCLMRYGYRAILMITNFDSVTENNCFTLVRQNKIDGIIALSNSPNLDVDDYIPMVTIDRHFSNSIPCISSDNYQGGEVAAQKLIALGCRNLLFLSIGSSLHSEVEKRGLGFINACRIANVKREEFVLCNDGNDNHRLRRWLCFLDGQR